MTLLLLQQNSCNITKDASSVSTWTVARRWKTQMLSYEHACMDMNNNMSELSD